MQYDLVFEGGGAKGMSFAGALQAFTEAGHTPGRLLGTSAGAISATLVAAGYTPDEMLTALAEREDERSVFAGFMGIPAPVSREEVRASATRAMLRAIDLPLVPDFIEERLDDSIAQWVASHATLRHVYSFVERGGWYAADRFLPWICRRLDTGMFRGAPRAFSGLTLAGYKAATGADLTLIASDLTGREMLMLNHKTAPDVPVAWAVRMSMNIPLLWQEVIWQAEWGTYRGRSMKDHAIVDGGLLSNFPLELLISRDERVTAVMGERTSEGVMGMLIDEGIPVPGAEAPAPREGFSFGSLPTVQRLRSLVDTVLCARDKLVIDAFEGLVARLPAGGCGTTEFDMPEAKRALLVQAGRDAMTEHLARLAEKPVSFGLGPDPDTERAEAAADKLAQRLLG